MVHFATRLTQTHVARWKVIGTLRNYDGDGNGNLKTAIRLMSKMTTLHVHHAFLYIFLQSLQTFNVKWPNFELTWERERQGDNFYYLSLPGRGPLSSVPT